MYIFHRQYKKTGITSVPMWRNYNLPMVNFFKAPHCINWFKYSFNDIDILAYNLQSRSVPCLLRHDHAILVRWLSSDALPFPNSKECK